MKLKIYQVDAFASSVFEGNPAAVCPLNEWLGDDVLQKIAQENNLSETAFFVVSDNSIHLRWFTPMEEVDLCGHATLASAFVLYEYLHYTQPDIRFITKSG
ncbi:MAG: PhzF family phenazine biosynthesis isomerase, partial [Nonlabens ulvanivorans]|uniref:PhzF family phenazine biosynthesis protein n=1 Tax=Nonlabens ulvanivorans TaxID=906888 RepID=UPI003264CD9B